MTWVYSGDPTTSHKDAVRLLIGDTDTTFQLMQDEEINWVIGLAQSVYDDDFMSASICADIVASAFAREVDISADGVSASVSQMAEKYQSLAVNLRKMYDRIRGVGGGPIVGGIDAFSPPDFSVKPLIFGTGFTDNFRAGQQDYGNRGDVSAPYDYAEYGYWNG